MFSPSNLSARYSPAKHNTSPSKYNHSPLKNLLASRSTTLDTSVSPAYLNTPKSHNRSRSIGKKLDVQLTIETSPLTKTEDIETKIRNLDEKITNNHDHIDEKLNLAENQIVKLDETMGAEIVTQKLLDERIVKEMSLVEGNLAVELQNEKQQCKDSERKILNKIEIQIQSIRNNFAEEQTKTEEVKQEQSQVINEKVHNLRQSIKQEQLNRETILNSIAQNVSNKLAQIQENMNTQRKRRQENEAMFLQAMENLFGELQNRVDYENDKRERGEMQMSNLIEETCNKFEDHLGLSRM